MTLDQLYEHWSHGLLLTFLSTTSKKWPYVEDGTFVIPLILMERQTYDHQIHYQESKYGKMGKKVPKEVDRFISQPPW
ncbi:hypothetical protein M514_01271 [Trichuris suis]|uniref:Uncharacterized protein n=1 Tax=Trichuris suis TaxID=68888 RepID=A0A085NMT0_9BILA|nr:hypothetical protein M514_01271 [Trichuris suis]